MIRKIKMWYWKHFNRPRYIKEVFSEISGSLQKTIDAFTAITKALSDAALGGDTDAEN